MKTRTFIATLMLTIGVAMLTTALRLGAADATCPVDGCFTLAAPGDHKFWDGPYINLAQVPDPALCGTPGVPCFKYQLTVGGGGDRLRVGFDTVLQDFRPFPDPPGGPPPGARFRIQVKKEPAGPIEEVCVYPPDCPGEVVPNGGYSTEMFVPSPAAGVWTVTVIPTDVTDLAFRMRARLEPQPTPAPVYLQLPNLRIIPPYELTFTAPAYPFGPAGPPGVSCMPEEMAPPPGGEGAVTCLRFSAGVHNNGEGWLGIQFYYPQAQPCEEPMSFRVFQRLRYSDDTIVSCNGGPDPLGACQGRDSAGCAVFHPSHGHFHYEGIYRYTLFEVPDLSTGKLETPAGGGAGHKRGFDPADEEMADWHRFYQEPPEAPRSGPDSDLWFTLGVGWGDIYDWNRSGQYVDFPVNPDGTPADGYYVIQGVTDVDDNLLESDENDNTGYTFLIVQGQTVGICERGYGKSPWDPNKVVLPASADITSDALSTQVSPACAAVLQPDLQVTSVVASPNQARQGEKITITATIANTGLSDAAVSQTRFVLDDIIHIATVDTPAIPARGSVIVSTEWRTSGEKGQHTIRVTADQSNAIAEQAEDNNTRTTTVTIKGNRIGL